MKKTKHIIFLLLIILLTTVLSGYVLFRNDYPRQEERQNIRIDPTPKMFGMRGLKDTHRIL